MRRFALAWRRPAKVPGSAYPIAARAVVAIATSLARGRRRLTLADQALAAGALRLISPPCTTAIWWDGHFRRRARRDRTGNTVCFRCFRSEIATNRSEERRV